MCRADAQCTHEIRSAPKEKTWTVCKRIAGLNVDPTMVSHYVYAPGCGCWFDQREFLPWTKTGPLWKFSVSIRYGQQPLRYVPSQNSTALQRFIIPLRRCQLSQKSFLWSIASPSKKNIHSGSLLIRSVLNLGKHEKTSILRSTRIHAHKPHHTNIFDLSTPAVHAITAPDQFFGKHIFSDWYRSQAALSDRMSPTGGPLFWHGGDSRRYRLFANIADITVLRRRNP